MKENGETMAEASKRAALGAAFRSAFPHTIPLLTGFLVLGAAYGTLMQSKGYGVLWSVLMSAVAFCGSMQFVAITLLTTVFNPLQAFLLSLMVNARHLFYGISLLEKYRGLGKVRGFLIYVLCDETFSITSSIAPPDGIKRGYFYFCISFLNYFYWVLGTFLGGLAGNFIAFDTTGLDFVLTALFVVLFLEQMRSKDNRASGLVGVAGALLGLMLFGAEQLIIPSMCIILLLLLVGRKRLCR